MRRIDAWHAMQEVHMPMAVPLRAASETSPNTSEMVRAEFVALWLPSTLPHNMQALESLAPLRIKEARLRTAQLADSLEDVRRVRRILAAVSDYNRSNVAGEGQRMTTRMQDLYARFRAKERRAVNRYRAARIAMTVLEPAGEWERTFQVLLDTDLRGPRNQDDDVDPALVSEGRYQISWIWLVNHVGNGPRDATRIATADEFSDTMRTEWARSRARAERWEEEEKLLIEEMRRVIAYCKWRAIWWRAQARRRVDAGIDEVVIRGLAAYAEKQATVLDDLINRCGSRWYAYFKAITDSDLPIPPFLLPYESLAKPYRARRSRQTITPINILLEPELDLGSDSDSDTELAPDDDDDDL